jgi:ParB-like chromosome segregation protein Spo0J
MPVIVRDYSGDEATIIMVDSNIQREDILPSEKAKERKSINQSAENDRDRRIKLSGTVS